MWEQVNNITPKQASLSNIKLWLSQSCSAEWQCIIGSVYFSDSDYGQLSLETWRFLHDIYGGGPVFYTEGEKDNQEEKKDQQSEETQQE